MRDIKFYISEAKARSGISSDRKLGEFLELSAFAPTAWSTGRAWPSDDTMVKLARLAGIDPYIALLDLNTWRTSGEAQSAYKKLLEKITVAAVAVLIIAAPIPVKANPDGANFNKSASIHYHIVITYYQGYVAGL